MVHNPAARDALAGFAAEVTAGLDQDAVLRRAMRAVARVVDYDAGGWSITDPGTMLWTGGVLTGMDAEAGGIFFENELLEEDVNKFTDLVRRPRHVGLLSEATGGELRRSARYRRLLVPQGMGSELRVAATAAGACWGTGCLMRAAGKPDFTAQEVAFVEAVTAQLAHGLRATYALTAPWDESGGPGVLVVDDELRILSRTAEGDRWLAAIAPGAAAADAGPLPPVIASVVRRARACALGGGADGPPSARMRMADGRFLHVHASALGEHWAVVLEPARAPLVLPLIVEAHGLTPRERDVLGLLLRGKADKDIAAALVVSAHTAREHVRKVLAKFGVRTRAELAALLFDEHFAPTFKLF